MRGATSPGNERYGSGGRLVFVAARFYGDLAERLLQGARGAVAELGWAAADEYLVPGVFELPLAAQAAARSGRYAGIVALGVVIRGETAHFEYVCKAAADGLLRVTLDSGLPVAFGVLTTENESQALLRSALPGESGENKGAEAARAVVAMLGELARIDKEGR
jgi:6,7-dimethyl-8-ribityllumazine synthase